MRPVKRTEELTPPRLASRGVARLLHCFQPLERVWYARSLMAQGWQVRHIIGGVGPHGRKDAENARHMDVPGKEVFHSEDLDAISCAIGECSLVFSMKLHTTLVAAMYGVPTISLNPVVKARAFMEAAGCGDLVMTHDDRRLMSLIKGPVPPPPPKNIARLRAEASGAMRDLGQRLWDEFRAGSPALPEAAPLPE